MGETYLGHKRSASKSWRRQDSEVYVVVAVQTTLSSLNAWSRIARLLFQRPALCEPVQAQAGRPSTVSGDGL
jgi:hypothetical protein